MVQDQCRVSSADAEAPPVIEGFAVHPDPIAVASVACVYRARRISDGLEVAIKRIRPGVRQQIEEDVPLLMGVMAFAAKLGAPGALNMYELIRESREMLMGELDLRQEARAAAEFRIKMGDVTWVVVPRVVALKHECLVMQYVPSHKVSTVKGPNPALARRLMDLYMIMVRSGFVHADPHPGNLGILSGGRVVIYDFGAMLRVDGDVVGASVAKVLQSAVTKDVDGLIRALEEVGVMTVDRGRRVAVRRVLRRALAGEVHQELQNAPEFVDSEKRVVRFGTAFIYLARTLTMMTSACRTLDPGFEYDYSAWIPVDQAGGGLSMAANVLRDASAMPATMMTMHSDMEEFQSQILGEIEAGKQAATRVCLVTIVALMLSTMMMAPL
jgi:predicted unusual protein kinase regulating ubiquinone biosynthesis (AarF/ABC1/UbiB family)